MGSHLDKGKVYPVTLTLMGPVPSKKNLYRRGKSGGLFLNSDVSAQITALTLQAANQWQGEALKHPAIDVTFFVATRRGDRDNKLSCILDVLQRAGVLVNDNIASCNGRLTLHPAIVSAQERVVIDLEIT